MPPFHHHHPHHAFHPHHGPHHGHGKGPDRGPKMFDAGAMRFVVLQLIADKPRHGYELIKEIETLAGGGYAPSPGAIYPLLSMLLDLGHIDSAPDGNKKLHAITAEGRAFLDENRQLADAVLARLQQAPEGRDDLRATMHALKEAVSEAQHGSADEAARRAQIKSILQRATEEIGQLSQA